MRYYSIVITDPDTGKVVTPNSLKGVNPSATYFSFLNNQNLPGALDVELNVPVTTVDTPLGAAYVCVYGVSLQEIGQANDLVGKAVKVYAGMQRGLPLAKPQQSGLILAGFINQAWGNWIGVDMTLNLMVAAGTGTLADPKNIVHNWTKGTKLSDAITSTLSTAFPDYKADVKISGDLVLAEDDKGYYQTIEQYAAYVRQVSQSILGASYQGVRIVVKEKAFSVFDGTSPSAPFGLAFEDLIGQPTWIGTQTIQFKAVMRADLSVGDFVRFPPAVVTTTPGGASPAGSGLKASSIFQGSFQIGQMTHFGRFRQPDADSWNTTFNVFSSQAPS